MLACQAVSTNNQNKNDLTVVISLHPSNCSYGNISAVPSVAYSTINWGQFKSKVVILSDATIVALSG